jgi:transposase
MKNRIITVLVACTLLLIASCGKYEEGPSLSLRSKTARVSNTWKVEQYLYNGSDQTSNFNSLLPNYRETYDKDGNYSFTYDGNSGSGRWEFQNDKLEIKRSGVSSQPSETLVILRLKEKEFWYYILNGNDREEVHMIPAE